MQFFIAVPLPIPSDHLTFWTNADLNPIVLSFSKEVYEVSLSLDDNHVACVQVAMSALSYSHYMPRSWAPLLVEYPLTTL